MSFRSAIGLGIGFMVGVIIFIVVVLILLSLLKGKKGEFTVDMFEDYKSEIISEERYEEVVEVDKIIKSINSGKPDKRLLSNYEIDTTPELVMKSNDDDETSIKIKKNSKIVHKSRKKSKKK